MKFDLQADHKNPDPLADSAPSRDCWEGRRVGQPRFRTARCRLISESDLAESVRLVTDTDGWPFRLLPARASRMRRLGRARKRVVIEVVGQTAP